MAVTVLIGIPMNEQDISRTPYWLFMPGMYVSNHYYGFRDKSSKVKDSSMKGEMNAMPKTYPKRYFTNWEVLNYLGITLSPYIPGREHISSRLDKKVLFVFNLTLLGRCNGKMSAALWLIAES